MEIGNGYKGRLRECKIIVKNPFGIQISMGVGELIDLIKDEIITDLKLRTPPSEQ